MEITLEKIDIIRERTGATYTEAKEALEACEGNVVDALVYMENKVKEEKEELYTTKDELVKWIKDIIKKGNVTRIKVKKEDKIIVDIPVNAGLAATAAAAIIWAPILLAALAAAIVTKVTIEITKEDGSVEVVNKIIKSTAQDIKEKVDYTTSDIKEKFSNKFDNESDGEDNNFYSYTVNFEDVESEEDDNCKECKKEDSSEKKEEQ
ncbi:DUF4342 domain-containing protein [Clostridium sporogenes]|uniref:DUF4342 domain-containing protein n=1 Tax=Clostridium sporogenes TaxID=1509 RepID=A0A7X5SWJ4_CLOSG|nr:MULTISPECIES: DUF4342 domain-containing protein [Clostridium]AJD32991.1 UBA/TS-N domain protein [Clostridium botulinum Prevot_594]AVP60969.1 DUF4342 domain-containing protein [Clostridium botulinum]AKC63754.1 UBA/TS-N domain-containing protein [Clostridium sporogenes]AKJ90904.1 ubiquitin [Clostridium sporogenes]EHN13179.1 UBA/TS-N domain-containing protein [Clostridium sporogenes PA 3679]